MYKYSLPLSEEELEELKEELGKYNSFLSKYVSKGDEALKKPLEINSAILKRADSLTPINTTDRDAALKAAAAAKAAAAREKIERALEALKEEGRTPTIYAVAQRAGVSWATARKHLKS